MLNVSNLIAFKAYLETLHDSAVKDGESNTVKSGIRIEPEGFNMSTWRDDCGTACCLGGHVDAFFPALTYSEFRDNSIPTSIPSAIYVKALINLNLPREAQRALFIPSSLHKLRLTNALQAIQYLINKPNQATYTPSQLWGEIGV